MTPWFLGNLPISGDLAEAVALYRAGVEALRPAIEPHEEDKARIAALGKQLPPDLTRDWALLRRLAVAPEIAQLAKNSGYELPTVAKLYFGVGALLGLDRLRLLAARVPAAEHWDRMAIRRIVDDLFAAQRAAAQSLLPGMAKKASPADASRALLQWAEKNEAALDRTKSFLAALESAGDFSIAKLTLATSQIHKLAAI